LDIDGYLRKNAYSNKTEKIERFSLWVRNIKKDVLWWFYVYRIHTKTLLGAISELFTNCLSHILFSSIQIDMPDCMILKEKSQWHYRGKGEHFIIVDISPILLTIAKVSKLRVYILYELMETVRIHLIITSNIIFCFHTDILCHFPQYLRDLRRLKRIFLHVYI